MNTATLRPPSSGVLRDARWLTATCAQLLCYALVAVGGLALVW